MKFLKQFFSGKSSHDLEDRSLEAIEQVLLKTPPPLDEEVQLELELRVIRGLRAAQTLAHHTASSRGWYIDRKSGERIQRNFGEVVALMHSELSEALEADRRGLKDDKLTHRDGREVEFADLIIRVLDTAEELGLDIGGAFVEKNRFNLKRPDHDLKNRNADDGKKY